MSEEPQPKGTKLQHAIAQAKANIEAIDVKCTKLKKQAEALRVDQKELQEMLTQLEV